MHLSAVASMENFNVYWKSMCTRGLLWSSDRDAQRCRPIGGHQRRGEWLWDALCLWPPEAHVGEERHQCPPGWSCAQDLHRRHVRAGWGFYFIFIHLIVDPAYLLNSFTILLSFPYSRKGQHRFSVYQQMSLYRIDYTSMVAITAC